jgi:type II secretory pathway pseudopilin PulG
VARATRAVRERLGEDGFTTFELLISMIIMSVIFVPLLATTFVMGISTSRQADASSLSSSDFQNAAAFYATDIASATNVNTAAGCGTGTEVALLDNGAGSTPRYVSYTAAEDATAESAQHESPVYVLSRATCDSNMQLLSSNVVAGSMQSVPVPLCTPACSGAQNNPTSVSLTVSEWGAKKTDPVTTFTFSGTRRSI